MTIKKFLFNRSRKKRETFPRLLSIELSNLCNASCIMCPRDLLTRKIQHMSLDTLRRVSDSCRNRPLRKINLFWFGDSLCNRDFIDMARHIRHELPTVKLYLSTNAGLLSGEISRAIIDERLIDIINFDIDGATKATYESIRRRVDFDAVMKNARYFLDYRKTAKKRVPRTRVTIIKMQPTEPEIPAFIRYWSPLVDKVDISDYNTWLGTKDDLNVGKSLEKSQHGSFDFACIHPWDELVIAADGRAGLCCLDYDLKAPVGDINRQEIKEIWQGEAITGYREAMLRGEYGTLPVCAQCNAYIYQAGTRWARLQRA
jgi:MoaA/NifB/PqqE/SkfB family radical SAM enzyme